MPNIAHHLLFGERLGGVAEASSLVLAIVNISDLSSLIELLICQVVFPAQDDPSRGKVHPS